MSRADSIRERIEIKQTAGLNTWDDEEELRKAQEEDIHTELVSCNAPTNTMALTTRTLASLGAVFHASGMFPDIQSEAQAIVKILAGAELGFTPIYSMRKVYIIKGQVGLSSNAIASLIKRSDKYDYKVNTLTDTECVITFYEDSKPTYQSTYTMEDAARAKLIKPDSVWTKHPRSMLFARALSQGQSIACPDITAGGYYHGELQENEDFDGRVDNATVINNEGGNIQTNN